MKIKNKFYVSFQISNQITNLSKFICIHQTKKGKKCSKHSMKMKRKMTMKVLHQISGNLLCSSNSINMNFKKKVEDAKCDRLFKTNPGNGIFRKKIKFKKM